MSVRLLSLFVSTRALLACSFLAGLGVLATAAPLVSPDVLRRHVEKFNAMEPEGVVNFVPNAQAAEWLQANVPRFECPDAGLEEIYWFRWWALRKQLRRDPGSGRFVFGEFINRARPVSSAFGHHLMAYDAMLARDEPPHRFRTNTPRPSRL